MNLVFSEATWEDYLYWQSTDKKTLKRLHLLIKEIIRDPFSGIGKPEPLKHALSGYWSLRLTDSHRVVYRIDRDNLLLAQLRYHYNR